MDERIFDVSKPHSSKPDMSSKPIIVGHHPQMPDPMLREHAPDKPTSAPHSEKLMPKENFQVPAGSTPLPAPPPADLDGLMEKPTPAPAAEPPTPKIPAPMPPPPPGLSPPTHGPATPAQGTMPNQHPNTPWHPDKELPIPAHRGHHIAGSSRKKLPFVVLAVIVMLAALYAAIDSGLIGAGIDLPFHIFSQDKTLESTDAPTQAPTPTSSTLASGFTAYKLPNTDLSFSYPSAWGKPSVTSDAGYAKRGGDNQSTATYAYLINFASNKDIQLAVTSSQFLPAARSALYYDYQRWCSGTADGKLYKQLLHYTTAEGVDTPTTATCDQGPLADAIKLDEDTIFQSETTAADGSALGDLYTLNLTDNDWPVLRVKDASSAAGNDIKKLLASVKD